MKVDYHCHTQASDGSLSPKQIIDLALAEQVTSLAITDHDTTQGYEQAKNYAQEQGLELISGCEVSCHWQGKTIHVVALNIDVSHAGLQTGLQHIRTLREQRAQAMLDQLSAKPFSFIENMPAKLAQEVGKGVVGRAHFAQLYINEGKVKNTRQAFEKYLKKGKVGFVPSQWPDLSEVVAWIIQAGGVAVLAHPKVYKLSSRKLNSLIESFKEAGGQAIEVVNQAYFGADIIGLAQRAQQHRLHASLGSDFHRPEHTWRGLGRLAPLPEQTLPVWELFQGDET